MTMHDSLCSIALENTNQVVIGYRPGGKILLWNKAAEDTFLYSKEEAFKSTIQDLIVPPRERHRYTDHVCWSSQRV